MPLGNVNDAPSFHFLALEQVSGVVMRTRLPFLCFSIVPAKSVTAKFKGKSPSAGDLSVRPLASTEKPVTGSPAR